MAHPAAVDHQHLPGDAVGGARAEEHRGQVGRLPPPSGGDPGEDLLWAPLVLTEGGRQVGSHPGQAQGDPPAREQPPPSSHSVHEATESHRR